MWERLARALRVFVPAALREPPLTLRIHHHQRLVRR
jgi:hypothetical protein